MTMIETLEAELGIAEDESKSAIAKVKRLKLELDHARAVQAAHEGHAWAGKAVKRQEVRRPAYEPFRRVTPPNRNVTVRGIVTLCTDTRVGFGYRNHAPKAGEWFVLSASGVTAYSLGEGWELDNG